MYVKGADRVVAVWRATSTGSGRTSSCKTNWCYILHRVLSIDTTQPERCFRYCCQSSVSKTSAKINQCNDSGLRRLRRRVNSNCPYFTSAITEKPTAAVNPQHSQMVETAILLLLATYLYWCLIVLYILCNIWCVYFAMFAVEIWQINTLLGCYIC